MIVPPRHGRTAFSRRPRRRLTFDRVSLMVVFLGIPVALFLAFVLYPFIQAPGTR